MDSPAKTPLSKAPLPPQPAPAPQKAPAASAPAPRSGASARTLQRKCACGACADCGKKREADRTLQRQAKRPEAQPTLVPDVSALDQSSGKPLPQELRQRMESQFGHKFDDVLVHTDSPAAKAAASVHARAFTSGTHIYFAEGEYQPETGPGRELIAHELAHVVQQGAGRVRPPAAKLLDGGSHDPLEQEADRAAAAISGGRTPVVTGASDGRIHRAPAKCTGKTVPGMDDAGPLDIAAEKGSKGAVKQEYDAAIRDCRLSTLAKFDRPGTETLRNSWKKKSGVDFPLTLKPGGDVCEVDHIVELQIGGTNNPENLQLLEKGNNASAGSKIKSAVDAFKKTKGNEKLRFTSVNLLGDTSDKCRDWELANSGKSTLKNPLELIFGHRSVTVELPKPNATNEYPFTGSRKDIAAGIDFEKIVFIPNAKGDPDKGSMIRGKLASGLKNFVGAPQFIVELDINPDHTVTLRPAFQKLKTAFPYLSEAEFNAVINDDGYSGSAKFHPSLPLLKKGEVTIQVEKGVFSGGYKASAADITIPIPGVTITEASIEAAIKEASFSAKGALAFKVGAYADAKLTANADKDGFRADGTVDFHIPGLDQAQGKVSYHDKQLSGQIKIGKDKFKLPGIKSANLTVDITDTAITGLGEVELSVPGVKKGTLSFALDKKGNFAITGAAALSIPGVKESEISLTYAEGDLTGLAKLGLDVPGLQGAGATFEVRYAKGLLTGSGEIAYQKGKLTGKIHAQLTEKHKISGGGELAYEIFPGLVAGVGIEILEDGKAKVSGEIRVPDTINIFPEKAYEKKIFSFGVQIPIFAIPLGTRSVGLVADIGADIKARAGIGPGQLRGVKAKATLDLSKDDNALEFQAAAELFVPAYAELTLAVHGGLGLSLAIASATGGIELAASLGLHGALSTKVQINYQNGTFALDAVAELSAQPSLRFDISAYVKVEVDLFITTIEVYRKDWKLASKEWGSGLKIGVRFPVHYESGKPFNLSLDQLEFVKPEVDIKQAVKDLLPM